MSLLTHTNILTLFIINLLTFTIFVTITFTNYTNALFQCCSVTPPSALLFALRPCLISCLTQHRLLTISALSLRHGLLPNPELYVLSCCDVIPVLCFAIPQLLYPQNFWFLTLDCFLIIPLLLNFVLYDIWSPGFDLAYSQHFWKFTGLGPLQNITVFLYSISTWFSSPLSIPL